jgi:glycosyltransferase involved in cell wall biosynthesis
VHHASFSAPTRGLIALLVKNYQYGGTQRVLLRLANKLFDYGYPVHVVCPGSGPLEATLRDRVRRVHIEPGSRVYARALALRANPAAAAQLLLPLVVPLHPLRALPLLAPLATYLRMAQPSVLISGTASLNIVSTLAKRLAQVPTALVLTEHVSTDQRRITDWRFARRHLPALMRSTYRDANAIVGVSTGVTGDLTALLQVPVERVRCIYNPAVPDDIQSLARAPVPHRWFDVDQPPVILSAGRAGRTKDFAMLVRAFARVRSEQSARLVILSSASHGSPQSAQLASLRALARDLNVANDFEILDFTANPFAYMARAGVFASSSTSEGFGNVVAEALGCGCPVVSTRTEGPVEVLENGRFGRLVPVGDVGAMAAALIATLRAPRDSAELVMRAAAFNEERSARAYEHLCREVTAPAQALGT